MKRTDLVKQLSTKELTKAVFSSQLLFFFISIMLYAILIRDWKTLKSLFHLNVEQIFYFGVLFGLTLVVIEIILYNIIPKKHLDDGGINEKLFKNQSIIAIFFIALTVAIVEEFLFRGVIQTAFGFIFASSLFVIVHTRYLRKPILLLLIIITSFLIGYLFLLTNNLLVTITFHFVVDFSLGLFIKYKR